MNSIWQYNYDKLVILYSEVSFVEEITKNSLCLNKKYKNTNEVIKTTAYWGNSMDKKEPLSIVKSVAMNEAELTQLTQKLVLTRNSWSPGFLLKWLDFAFENWLNSGEWDLNNEEQFYSVYVFLLINKNSINT